jgi:hypothetical protein
LNEKVSKNAFREVLAATLEVRKENGKTKKSCNIEKHFLLELVT